MQTGAIKQKQKQKLYGESKVGRVAQFETARYCVDVVQTFC